MRNFKHIDAWKRGHALGIALHKATAGFRRKGHAQLRAQLTRAADSISTNIVEGAGASSNREFARYLEIAIKSANETEHHLLTVQQLQLLPDQECLHLIAETIEVRKMTYGYRQKVLADA